MNLYKYLLSILLLSFTSCNSFLKEDPTDFVSPANFFSNEKEVFSSLIGVYDILGKREIYGRYMFFEMDMSDEGYFGLPSTGQDLALYNYDIGDGKLLAVWTSLYNGINRANVLLENIDKADMDDQLREVYRGEALFLRGYYYFLLTSNWGRVPLRLESTKS